ncbi:MAG: class I SAM-dependent methyltransferase [Planctomycetota bacterium]
MNSTDPRIGYFDSLAANWDFEEPSTEDMVTGLSAQAELLDLRSGEDLLEVGCGTGKTTGWLAGQVAPGRVTAIDFSEKMIELARRKPLDADFACLDVCSDDLGRDVYDVILCFHSFPHFRDQRSALENFAAALKPSGRLIVMHLVGSERLNQFHADLSGPVKGDVLPVGDQWPPLLDAAGLRQTKLIDRQDLFFLKAVSKDR